MGPVLSVLGVKLLVVPDEEACALLAHRIPKIADDRVRVRSFSQRAFHEWGKQGGRPRVTDNPLLRNRELSKLRMAQMRKRRRDKERYEAAKGMY